MKWLISILFLVLLMPFVSGGMCQDKPVPNVNCTMLTPTLGCSTNYTLMRENGSILTTGSMSSTSVTGIYSFGFNRSYGDYLIKLCDGTTREVYVGGNMDYLTLLILVFAGFMLLLIYIVNQLSGDTAKFIKACYYGLIVLVSIGLLSIVNKELGSTMSASSNALLSTVYYVLLVAGLLYCTIVLCLGLFKSLMFLKEKITKIKPDNK